MQKNRVSRQTVNKFRSKSLYTEHPFYNHKLPSDQIKEQTWSIAFQNLSHVLVVVLRNKTPKTTN